MEKNKLARRIRAFRKLKGVTQTELAERMGVSVGLLGAIERGTRRVEEKLVHQIALALEIDEAELAGKDV